MTSAGIRPLATELADRLRQSREDLARRWLERISARVTLSPNRVFPTDELLNHIPLLIDGIAAYLEGPGIDLDAEGPVTAKARELGALRHAQGFDAYEILKEHELLGGIVLTFLTDTVEEIDLTYERRELLECWHRITDAVELIRQATAQQFLQLSAERVREREERLRRFNRMVSHELKNRVGAIRGAAGLLGETWLGNDERERFVRMVKENSAGCSRISSSSRGSTSMRASSGTSSCRRRSPRSCVRRAMRRSRATCRYASLRICRPSRSMPRQSSSA
jgi:signal transduction histidine kinase